MDLWDVMVADDVWEIFFFSDDDDDEFLDCGWMVNE